MNKTLPFCSLFFLLTLGTACLPVGGGKAPASSEKKEILVGAFFPMTGPIATYGQESVNGFRMALEAINEKGIKGKKIHLILEDNKGEPAESANAVRKLIDVDKVDVLFGAVASSNTLAAAPIAQAAKVPLLTPAATNEEVTKRGDYIMRSCFTDDFQGLVMAKFARQSLGKSKGLIVVDVASDYSRGLASVFSREFSKMGGTILPGTFNYNQGDKDFRSLINRIKRAAPEFIYVPGYYTEGGLLLRQAKEMGVKVPFLAGDGWDSPKLHELAGSGVAGHFISTHFSAQDSDPAVKEFVKKYKENYGGQVPGAMAALAYDGMWVIADALRRAPGKLTGESIRNALAATKNFPGITGHISIDKNRNAKKSAVVMSTTGEGMNFKERVAP